MFPEMKFKDEESFVLRPMACPHHIMIYKHKKRSYKELPLRLAEHVNQFRFEPSGSLLGLERTRAMELTDSHIFLRDDQLESEIKLVLNLVEKTLAKFNIKIDYIELALRDKKDLKKYHGDSKK
jgi:threonyl-tRNA synthetase